MMAQRVVEEIVDDIDGNTIQAGRGGRVEFSCRGVDYQIDLSAANIARFEAALSPFIEAATKASFIAHLADASSTPTPASGEPAIVRQWARLNGHGIAKRGRIPANILDAFKRAH